MSWIHSAADLFGEGSELAIVADSLCPVGHVYGVNRLPSSPIVLNLSQPTEEKAAEVCSQIHELSTEQLVELYLLSAAALAGRPM